MAQMQTVAVNLNDRLDEKSIGETAERTLVTLEEMQRFTAQVEESTKRTTVKESHDNFCSQFAKNSCKGLQTCGRWSDQRGTNKLCVA